jgi:hypothetical protein
LFVDSSGRVGIGASPQSELQVNASDTISVIQLTNSTTGATNTDGLWLYNNGADATLSNLETGFLRFETAGTERLRLTSTGLVGVGTSSPDPSFRATIAGSRSGVGPGIFFSDTDASPNNYSLYIDGTKNFVIRDSTNSLNRITVTPAGLVGIGTSAPNLNTSGTAIHVSNASSGNAAITRYTTGDTGVTATDGLDVGMWSDGDAFFWLRESSNIRFATASTERLRIDSSGRVGIGTTSPDNPLTVAFASSSTWTPGAILSGTTNTDVVGLTIRNNDASASAECSLLFIAGLSNNAQHSITSVKTANNLGDLVFRRRSGSSASAESLRIDSSGRLLVGTSTSYGNYPAILQTQNNSGYAALFGKFSNNAAGPDVEFFKGRGGSSASVRGIVQNNDSLGLIQFSGDDGTNGGIAGAVIQAYVDGTPGANDMPGRLVFSTTADGAASPTERMRINSNGIIQARNSVGDTLNLYNAVSAGTSSGFLYGVHSSSSVYTGTTSFVVYTNGNVVNTNGSYTTLSDAKLKENIVDAGSQWSDLKAIQIRNWNFKAETGHETHRQIGPIAQELEAVCPGLVFETPDRNAGGNKTGEVTKGVNQSVLYMKAVKALQEAMGRIEQLETSNADLLARVTALEAQ